MNNAPTNEFLNLFLTNQSRIYTFILGQLGNYHDADDVMQETTSLLWQKFDEFEPGTDFLAWSLKVAKYKVLNFLQKKRRLNARVIFDDDVLELLTPRIDKINDNLEKNIDIVRECMGKLTDRDLKFAKLRYYSNIKPKDLSQRFGINIQNTYKRLARIHARLLKCVRHNIQIS